MLLANVDGGVDQRILNESPIALLLGRGLESAGVEPCAEYGVHGPLEAVDLGHPHLEIIAFHVCPEHMGGLVRGARPIHEQRGAEDRDDEGDDLLHLLHVGAGRRLIRGQQERVRRVRLHPALAELGHRT